MVSCSIFSLLLRTEQSVAMWFSGFTLLNLYNERYQEISNLLSRLDFHSNMGSGDGVDILHSRTFCGD